MLVSFGCICVFSFIFVSICLIFILPFFWSLCFFLFLFFFFLCVCVFCVFCSFFKIFCMPVCFNNLYWHMKHLVEFWFPEQKLGLSFWGGSTESRTLDCQRIPTQGKINQWELPEKHPPDFRTQNHVIACSTQNWTPKSNNKQGKTTNTIISRQAAHMHPQMHHLT